MVRALDRPGEFKLAWQPRIALDTGACTGAEALLRWNSPRLGSVPPDQFVPLLEATPLMPRLTDLVLHQALRQLRVWREAGLLPGISVNVAARDLDRGDLPERIRLALARAGLDGAGLELELTETAVLRDRASSQAQLGALRDLGVGIAIDDFGMGESSFSYLRQIPATAVKLDRDLVAGITRWPRDRIIVAAMVRLVRRLGLRSVAEGVEQLDCAALLRQFGCGEGQGYLFSRPVGAERLEAWLRRQVPFAVPVLPVEPPASRPDPFDTSLALLERNAALAATVRAGTRGLRETLSHVRRESATLRDQTRALRRTLDG